MLQLSEKNHDQKSFQINKQDNKFVSRLISKETSIVNSSCRVYYGEAAAVPFEWESQPGTPKHTLSQTSLPPLTPPPSYSSSTTFNSNNSIKSLQSNVKVNSSKVPNLTTKFFRKSRKLQSLSWSSVSSTYSSSSSSFSLNSSSASSNSATHTNKVNRCFSLDSNEDEKGITLCFRPWFY